MLKVNVSRTLFSLSIAISVALTLNLRKLNFTQISQRMSESFEYVGHDNWRPHVCAHPRLSPHDCAQTRLFPDTFVPRPNSFFVIFRDIT